MAKETLAQRTEAESLFCARVEDLLQQMEKSQTPKFTRFLDEREQMLAKKVLQKRKVDPQQYFFWTGFEANREESAPSQIGRRMLGIFPDYITMMQQDDRATLVQEEFPICSATLFWRKEDEVTHRDILGSLMGLDIKRELIGEILVEEGRAVIFCTETAQHLVLSELDKVGRAGIRVQQGHESPLPPLYRLSYETGTVSSLRLDCAVSAALNVSRDKSAALITGGLVHLNFLEESKISKEVKEGDILSIRGYGRYVLAKVGSLSKKGRLHIMIGKYI